MALIKINYYSNALGIQTSFYAIIPQADTETEIGNKKGTGERKNLLLLHGLSDDNTIWLRRTSIERYADRYLMNIIMPCGGRSFYTDMKYGGKYYTHVAKEVPETATEFLKLPKGREKWFVAGLSMGGYGAMKIALKENEFFAGAGALSPVTKLSNVNFTNDMVNIFGSADDISPDEDLFALVKKFNGRKNNPKLMIINGKQDFMFEDYLDFLKTMETLSYDMEHYEYEGEHTWELWDEHIVDIMEKINKEW